MKSRFMLLATILVTNWFDRVAVILFILPMGERGFMGNVELSVYGYGVGTSRFVSDLEAFLILGIWLEVGRTFVCMMLHLYQLRC